MLFIFIEAPTKASSCFHTVTLSSGRSFVRLFYLCCLGSDVDMFYLRDRFFARQLGQFLDFSFNS